MSEKFTLISSLDDIKVGDQFEQWPLHVTVMPWFSLPEGRLAPFDNRLRNMMHNYKPMTMTGKQEAMFGPESDVRVRVVGDLGAFAVMHEAMRVLVNDNDGEVLSPYVGDAFVPHITFQGEQGIDEGQVFTLSGLQLIAGDATGPREVRKQYRFMKGQPKRG